MSAKKISNKSFSLKELPVCPRCGSTEIKNVYLMSPTEKSVFATKEFAIGKRVQTNRDMYGCKACGYYGICPIIASENIAAYQKEIQKNPPTMEYEPPEIEHFQKRFFKGYLKFSVILFAVGILGIIILLILSYNS